MQLKPVAKGVRRQLIAASCALLGAGAARSQEVDTANTDGASGNWVVDSALAYYKESNGRVTALEPVINLRREDEDGSAVSFNLTYDSLSGASPNGAVPSTVPQTFASPSGTSLSAAPQTYTTSSGQLEVVSAPIYTIAPGALPMDPNYHDQRLALGGSWQVPLSRLTRATLGGDLSYEHDFFSTSVNASIAHDFNQKNTTLSFGVNGEFDSVKPIGGAPLPGSDYALFEKTGSKSKNGAGALLGVTQVMTRHWMAEFNLAADRFTGYLNDPYKILSVVDGSGNTTGYLYEKRPDSRTRKSAYLENRLAWNRASVALSVRRMTDDWGVRSNTAQLHLRWWDPERDRYLEPTVRWYRQTAADFYTRWIASGANQIVTAASADERLGAFQALTYGIKYGADLEDGSELSIRLEYYRQSPESRTPGPGALRGLDLYPGLKAVLLQVGWRFGF